MASDAKMSCHIEAGKAGRFEAVRYKGLRYIDTRQCSCASDRQTAIRIWERHPDLTTTCHPRDLTGAGEREYRVPPVRGVWSRAIQSIDSLRSHPLVTRLPYHSPRPSSGPLPACKQATGGPEQAWRVLTGLHAALTCGTVAPQRAHCQNPPTRMLRHISGCVALPAARLEAQECRSLWLDRPSDVTTSWPVILQAPTAPRAYPGPSVELPFPQFVPARHAGPRCCFRSAVCFN